jgi:lipopolysaccharide export system permease protein
MYLLKAFLPRVAGAMVLFSVVIALVDLFANLWRFLSLDAPLVKILEYILLGFPYSLVNAVPVAMLFAASYSLADLGSSGELPVIFGSGISLAGLTLPLVLVSVLVAGGSFVFDDAIAVAATRDRNALQRVLLHERATFSNTDIAVISRAGRFVYHAGYYDDSNGSLSDLIIVERNAEGEPLSIYEAVSAKWRSAVWTLHSVRHFSQESDSSWTERTEAEMEIKEIDEPPETFRSQNRDIREMNRSELAAYSSLLERAGLPSAHARSELDRRHSFAFAPIIVTLLSIATGGRFRKNILLASLLVSLVAATVYYVAQMMGMLLAKTGGVSPALGAWFPLALFAFISLGLLAAART